MCTSHQQTHTRTHTHTRTLQIEARVNAGDSSSSEDDEDLFRPASVPNHHDLGVSGLVVCVATLFRTLSVRFHSIRCVRARVRGVRGCVSCVCMSVLRLPRHVMD